MRFRFGMFSAVASMGLAAFMPPVRQNERVEMSPGGGVLKRQHGGKGQNNRRGRGKVDRPKKRRNMRLVSKRIRRKHRRAA